MEITYTKIGDYYLPNIIAPQSKVGGNIGKYGGLRLNYLKQNNKVEYIILRTDNKLYEHLLEVENECKALIKVINLYYKLQSLEEKEIYFKGGMDAYFYFKKLGILR